jgi:hypothetical protein
MCERRSYHQVEMKPRLLAYLVYPALASIATVGLHYLAGWPWLWSALAAFIAWPIVGRLITLDDDLPGGWSHPGSGDQQKDQGTRE